MAKASAKFSTSGPWRIAQASLAASIGFWPPPGAKVLPMKTTPPSR